MVEPQIDLRLGHGQPLGQIKRKLQDGFNWARLRCVHRHHGPSTNAATHAIICSISMCNSPKNIQHILYLHQITIEGGDPMYLGCV
jgi:hypothetical protein